MFITHIPTGSVAFETGFQAFVAGLGPLVVEGLTLILVWIVNQPCTMLDF